MKFFALPPLVMATIIFYVGLYHLIIYWKGGAQYRKDLTFAFACFFVGMNDVMVAFLYNSSSVSEGAIYQTKQPFFYGIGIVFLLWFVHDHARVGKRRNLIFYSTFVIISALITLFVRTNLTWRFDLNNTKIIHLPFGHEITYYEIGGGPLTDLLNIVLILGVLFFLAMATIKTYRSHQNKRKAMPFLFSLVIYLVTGTNDHMVYKGYYEFIYVFEYSFLGFILLMTYSLSRGVLKSAIMKDALKTERDLLQSLLDNIPDLIYFKDMQNRYIRINKAFCALLGIKSKQRIVGKTDYDIFSAEFASKLNKDEQIIKDTKKPLVGKIEHETLPNGKKRWVSITKVPILNNENEIDKIVGISRDITDIKRTTEALEKAKLAAESANRVKNQFLANMSHELRTPMNGILGMLELALNASTKENQLEYLMTIKKAADDLLILLNNLLDVTDIENENLELELEKFNMKLIIDEVIHKYSEKASAKNIKLTYQINSDVPIHLKGDPIRLKQIMIQILDNAIKFTKSGAVKFTVDLNSDFRNNVLQQNPNVKKYTLQFSVSDTGVGLSEENLEKIFNNFYQLDGSLTRNYGGTGIGLSIAKKLVQMMGGKIWVESELNNGSTFYFTITIEKAKKPASSALKHLPVKNRRYKILLVEDNLINQKVTSRLIENAGHQVVVANNGVEALDILSKEHDFHFILMDIQMPEMDGYETTTNIRNSAGESIDQNIPIIALTAHALKSDKEKCLELGMNEFLTKPIEPDRLFEVIDQVMLDSLN